MKKPYALLIVCIMLPLQAAASGEIPIDEHKLSRDKIFAIKAVNQNLKRKCISNFSEKVKGKVRLGPAGNMQFSERITRMVYNTFYWKNSDRGVAFIVPVQATDPQLGTVTTEVACFYAVAEKGLEFQLSQQLIWRLPAAGM